MSMRRRAAAAALAIGLAGVPAGCGEEDAKEVERETRDEAGEVKRDAEKKGKEVKTGVENEIND